MRAPTPRAHGRDPTPEKDEQIRRLELTVERLRFELRLAGLVLNDFHLGNDFHDALRALAASEYDDRESIRVRAIRQLRRLGNGEDAATPQE